MKNKRRKPTKRNSDIYWNILAYENVGEKRLRHVSDRHFQV